MYRRRIIGLIGICLLLASPLVASDLSSIIRQAKENSSRIQMIELNKANNDISISMSDIEDTMGWQISGDVRYIDPDSSVTLTRNMVEITPSLTLTFPNSGATSITIEASPIQSSLDGSGDWRVAPKASLSHSFRFGDNGDILNDLRYARGRITYDYQYRKSLLEFESSIYQKIAEMLSYEKNLLEIERDLLIQRTQLENALTLRTITEGSTTYRNMQLALAKLENAKISAGKRLEMAKAQYRQYTGLEWTSVESMQPATLSFTFLPTGDATVVLAAMDLEIAREELALTQRRTVSTSGGKTVPSLTIGGGVGMTHSVWPTPATDYTLNGNASYQTGSLTARASASMIWNDNGSRGPVVSIGGTWQNNPRVASEVLEMQSLENAVAIAEIEYQDAMLAYQMAADTLETDILNHQLEVAAFESEAAYRQQVLEQTQDRFERGLITETEVNNARLDVELSTYERNILALQALILENRASILQL